MKAVLIFFCTCFFFIDVSAQDISTLIKSADKLEAVPDEKGAFIAFNEVLKLQPTNIYAINKCSELCSRIGQRQPNKIIRDDYYKAAETYAGIALRIDSDNAEANCVMAIALGKSTMSKSGKEKIIAAREIKKYVDRSIQNDPRNFKAWHVLGRWNYELSNLNIIERSAARLMYGSIPEGSIAEAIFAFEKCNSISNGFILNYMELAKAYKKNDQDDKAIASINKMLSMPNSNEDDGAIKEEGKKLLKQWQ